MSSIEDISIVSADFDERPAPAAAGSSATDSVIKRAADGKIKPAVLNTGSVSRALPSLSGGSLAAARFVADQGSGR